MPFTDAGWDALGRFVAALGMMAIVVYLLPGVVALSPAWARRLEVLTFALIGVALLVAVGASVAWFVGR